MKKLILLLLSVPHIFLAQNLVPNFGFEGYDSCPTWEEVEKCTGWSKISNINSSPDYLNSCAPSSSVGVPQSFYLHQQDHRNCGAYMGLVTWTNNPNEREQIGTQLSQPLIIGQKYYISFYAVMGGSNFNGDYLETPSNNIGLRFSKIAYSPSNPAPIDNFAHIRSATIITDSLNWLRISGSITADSAYKYLMLGNFYDDANTDTLTQTCGTCKNYYSYYLIDDVCVSTDSTLCNGGIDLLPCNVSVKEIDIQELFTLYPNPTNDYFNIQNNSQDSFNINIYNIIGQQLYSEQNITSNNLQLNVSRYSSVVLFITVTSNNNQFTYKLLKH